MDRVVRASLLAFCLSWAAVAPPQAAQTVLPTANPDAALLNRIDAVARAEADAGVLSGVILVARGDRILLQKGYGFASWELRVPAGAATRFGIGSITKPMTEVVVDLLVAEGRLDLDAPASRYLGSFPAGPRGGAVTVRHLLEHRAGVPHRVTSALDETLPLHPADLVERVRAKGLLFEPGSQELYSSAGFSGLARIVERIEGKPFDTVLADRIFRPASMTASSGESGQTLMPGRALPHRLGADAGRVVVAAAPYKHYGFLTGAGSVYATAEDLLRFARALRSGVVGAAGKARVEARDGQDWRGWYGRTEGYEASVDVLPASDLAFVFLSNLRSAANWQVRNQVKRLLTGGAVEAILRPPPPAASFENVDAVLGRYGDAADPIVIADVDGHLFRDDNEVYPVAGERYAIPASGSLMRFRRTAGGVVDALVTNSPWAPDERIALRLPDRQ